MRVIELRDRLGFTFEALFALRALRKVFGKNLDGYRSVEAGVLRFVNLSIPPAPIGERIL